MVTTTIFALLALMGLSTSMPSNGFLFESAYKEWNGTLPPLS